MDRHPAFASGRVAVITGGASGIGLAAARRLGEAGMRIVIADLAGEALTDAAKALRAAGIETEPVGCDVRSRPQVAALKAAADAMGEVSVLMNNAGREGGGALFADPDVWKTTLDTNLWGPIHAIQLFAPAMMAAPWRSAIINTGSKQGITLPPGDTAYNVSKAALKALTESLAHELRESGGQATAHLLIPGFTFTGFTRARGVTQKPAGAWSPEEVVDFMLARMAAGDFYILCPDNEVTRETDLKRIRWSAADIVENRPALSRWHPDYKEAFEEHMRQGA